MNNIAFEQFFNWLRTTNHMGPVGITAKFYVKGEVISEGISNFSKLNTFIIKMTLDIHSVS